ncbi:MAG TPA: ABC transporter permease [Anaerolineae bacterium]|nr:ABC transporter permease [Anaerolineae bacterium]
MKTSTLRSRLARFFTLLLALVQRDVTTRYRRSMLGPAWAILQPLILMVVFNLIRGVVDIPSEGVPYLIFSYSALVPWTFFSNGLMYCGPSILSNAAILKKMALPREVFPLAGVTVALFDLAMSGLILLGMMVWFRVQFTWALLWLPFLVLITGALALGVGMFIAALGVFRRDFVFATPFLAQIWLFATPVIYPLSSVPEKWQSLYMLNPMVGLIEGFRSVLVKGNPPSLETLAVSTAVTALILIVSWPMFRWISQYFADVL